MSLEETLKDIPDLEKGSGSEGTEPVKFIRVSLSTHKRLEKLGKILKNVYGKHYSHNDTIIELLDNWDNVDDSEDSIYETKPQ